jgi:pimeloyl-ACP methyl ester carboxylesterase
LNLVNRRHFSDLRGALRLAVDATVGITDLVERMHHTIQLGHAPVGVSRATQTSGLTGLVYRGIRGTTRWVGRGLDAGMTPLTALLPETGSPLARDTFVSAINGVYGDHLLQTGNPLAIDMGLRYQGLPVDTERPDMLPETVGRAVLTGKLMVFVHGLCLNDNHWTRDGQNHADALAIKLGFTPLYLRYNTGLPITENGRNLAILLESLLYKWPHPVSELVMIGHSMGGLVARSACHHGGEAGHGWQQQLRRLVTIGSPHHGAPLERGGNWLDIVMDLSPYAAPFTRIAKKRSAGINDLRYGSITGVPREFVPLPAGVDCYAIAATLAKKRSRVGDVLIGDGLVPVNSALGKCKDPARTLLIPESRQWIGYETGHMALLGSPEVYKQLHDWFC